MQVPVSPVLIPVAPVLNDSSFCRYCVKYLDTGNTLGKHSPKCVSQICPCLLTPLLPSSPVKEEQGLGLVYCEWHVLSQAEALIAEIRAVWERDLHQFGSVSCGVRDTGTLNGSLFVYMLGLYLLVWDYRICSFFCCNAVGCCFEAETETKVFNTVGCGLFFVCFVFIFTVFVVVTHVTLEMLRKKNRVD